MSEQWVVARIKQKGDSKCVPWRSLKDAILTHPDVRKRLDVFALSIYGLVVFPKALGHVDEAVTDLFDRLDKKVTPISAILAETFRSLSACRKMGERRFIRYAQLLLAWFHSHFWKKWIAILQNLQEEDVEWRAPWLLPDEILYRGGSFDWVPLLGIWGAIGYTPLLVLRQYRSRQFIPATQGIADCEFSYKDDGYKKKIQEMLAVGSMTTFEYHEWWARRINDNTPKLNQENSQSIEKYLRVIPSELEIIRQDFERRNANLEKKIEQMEAKKTNLRLDIDVQKLENEKLKKQKNKAEEDLGSLKTDYKKLQMQRRNEALEKILSESQKENGELKDRVIVLEGSLRQYRNRNSTIELKASLSKIEEMKKRIEELETTLQNGEIQIKHLKANESRNNERLHYFQSQVRDRDHLMEEAVVQIREVADYIQALAVQVDMLSVKYELESDREQE
ncbi:hypothetical protein V6Z11_D01G074800 [Gossypium hirsutum]